MSGDTKPLRVSPSHLPAALRGYNWFRRGPREPGLMDTKLPGNGSTAGWGGGGVAAEAAATSTEWRDRFIFTFDTFSAPQRTSGTPLFNLP